MKKRFVIATLFALTALFGITACGADPEGSSKEPPKKIYTVTFVQAGQDNVVREVQSGATLTDIPAPKDRTGYTVVWEQTNYTNITENVTVNAVETPNTYTITYVAEHGTLESYTQSVTYDAKYTLATPADTGVYTFSYWKQSDGTSITQNGTWKTADNVTLTAEYAEPYTITFIQTGQEAVIKKVAAGGSLASEDIPAPVSKTGYNVTWDVVDFTNINESFTVNAIETAKTYTISYSLGECADDSSVSIESYTQTVTYDQPYNLYIPKCDGYKFVKWINSETKAEVKNGTWTTDDNLSLTAIWEEEKDSDRWWTGFY